LNFYKKDQKSEKMTFFPKNNLLLTFLIKFFINIKFNYCPIIKGKGSAIFLHLTNINYKPTSGCIAIVKKDFLKILPLINKKTRISIS